MPLFPMVRLIWRYGAMLFNKNQRYLRRKFKIGQDQLAEMLGYKSFTTIQKWEDGTSVPPYKVLEKLSAIYEVEVEDLMSKDLTVTPAQIPVLGTVRGGAPIYAEEQIKEYEPLSGISGDPEEYFCLDVVGDSMKNARIMPGDRLFVHKQDTLQNREIGVVLIGEEATVKRVIFENNRLILMPENEDYEPIILSEKDQDEKGVKILGKVVYNKIRY